MLRVPVFYTKKPYEKSKIFSNYEDALFGSKLDDADIAKGMLLLPCDEPVEKDSNLLAVYSMDEYSSEPLSCFYRERDVGLAISHWVLNNYGFWHKSPNNIYYFYRDPVHTECLNYLGYAKFVK